MGLLLEYTDKNELSKQLTRIRTGEEQVVSLRYSDGDAIKKLEAYIACINEELTYKAAANRKAVESGLERPYKDSNIVSLRARLRRAEKRIYDFQYIWSEAEQNQKSVLPLYEIDLEHNMIYVFDRMGTIRKRIDVVEKLRVLKIKWSRKNNRFQGFLTVGKIKKKKKIIKKYEA